jgi:hypothetical protein
MRLFYLILFLSSVEMFAATLNSDGSASDTQAKINSAVTGDTVLLPASGSFTWSSSVSIPSSKGITMDLNGRIVTLSGASGQFTINSPSSGSTPNRITNGSIVRGSGFNLFNGPFNIGDSRTGVGVVVDRLAFSGSNVIIAIDGNGKGVMHHCTFTVTDQAQEFIHINGWGPTDTTGWTTDSGASLAGSLNMFVIENNYFAGPTSGNPSWIQAYYGARFAFRFNTNRNVSVDVHGTPGNIGGRWFEIYGNQFTNTSGGNQIYALNIRAGSGIIASNTWTGSDSIAIGIGEEDTGSYPQNYQPGRGLNNTLDPIYVWQNWTSASLDACECQGGGTAGLVQLNRDVFASARPSYTIATYPHPLISGSSIDSVNLVDPARIVTWDPGVPGGIPSRTTIFTNMAGLDDTGATDMYSRIQGALNLCPSGQVVRLPSGSFRHNTELVIPNGVVLRGNGPTNTILKSYPNWHAIQIGTFPSSPVTTTVSGSPLKGATTITVGSVSSPAIAVGSFVVIDALTNTTEIVQVDQFHFFPDRPLSQMVLVTGIAGTTLTFSPALFHDYPSAQTPRVWVPHQGSSMTKFSGVEDLRVDRIQPQTQDGYSNFKFVSAAYCWLKNIESKDTIFWHVDVDRCFRLEIRDSFFNNGVFRTGGFAYGVDVFNSSTSCLIENNRFYRNRHSMVVAGDGGGNVFGYNCSIDSDQGDGWLAGDIFPHGSHSGADLFEGNVATKIQCDFTHGSSSYHMFYRNFIRVTSAFSTAGQGRRAVDMDIWNQYGNFLGNVLGSSGISWTAEETGATRVNSSIYIWSLGFFSDGDTTRDSTGPLDTIYRHGNYSARTSTTTWDSNHSNQTLINSYYKSSKPDWFGNLTWPPFSPSTGGSAAITDIPAGYKYINGEDPPSPNAGVLSFSASTYSVNESTTNGLTITVTRTSGTVNAITVQYATSSGTATSGTDFTSTSGTVSFANGSSTPQTFIIPIISDGVTEVPETFTVTLSSPTGGATLGTSTATVTIKDPPTTLKSVQFRGITRIK